jgi:NTE family protein
MTVALLLSGGAPNLTFMAGGLYELDELGVEYSLISTSGAGMLIGLLYAAPRGDGDAKAVRREALKKTVDMYVDDRIFQFMESFAAFPANYKVFHKPGTIAEMYTRFWQQVPRPQFGDKSSQRLFDDWTDLMLSTFCPTDLSPWSKGMCQPAPFIYDAVDFDKLKNLSADFVMNAYCIETHKMELFEKQEITAEHFQAALAFPLIYAPFKLNGKTYIEGSAVDTICFEPVFDYLYQPHASAGTEKTWSGKAVPSKYQPRPERPKVDTLLVFNMLGHEKLVREPRHLMDAFSQEIIVPLVPLTKDDIRIFTQEHLPRYQKTNPNLDLLEVRLDLTESEWDASLDWSHSNATTLFERGREAARTLFEANKERLTPKHEKSTKTARKSPRSKSNVVTLPAA